MWLVVLVGTAPLNIEARVGDLWQASPVSIRAGEAVELRVDAAAHWYIIEPLALDYDNVEYCQGPPKQGCHQPLQYSARELEEYRDKPMLRLSLPAGTHRLLALHDGEVSIPRARDAFVVIVRRDDSYVGYLSELLGVPFVLWPARLEDGHQTDLHLGADCVALVIYGRRRIGEKIPYVGPSALPRYTERVSGPAPFDEASGVKVGDVLDFGFQTAVLSRDREPVGRLDESDLIIHTYHGVAEETSLGAVPYHSARLTVRRWLSLQ